MIATLLFSPFARLGRRGLARAGAAFLVLMLGLFATAPPARADEPAEPLDPALLEQVRALALGQSAAVSSGTASRSPRVEVVLGQLDPRLRLAPCARIEPYMPANTRPWGKSRIGLRCTVGRVAWNVYLPITVKVFGRALVVSAGATAGSVLGESDLAEAEVDLAEEAAPAIAERKLVIGRVLAQSLKPGQTLRQSHLKARQWFAAGEMVRVVAAGSGFALESEAQAVSNGIEGQPARVRTESGRILTGQPAGERRLELTL